MPLPLAPLPDLELPRCDPGPGEPPATGFVPACGVPPVMPVGEDGRGPTELTLREVPVEWLGLFGVAARVVLWVGFWLPLSTVT